MTEKPGCDKALSATYGIKSLHDLVEKYEIDDNTFDGRTSTAPTRDQHGNLTTVGQVLALGQDAAPSSVGGGSHANGVVFLGSKFFDPDSFGVTHGFEGQAQELILLHEAVHAFGGHGDEAFGGSANLNKLLVEKCDPIAEHKLGGLYP
jgi:hypothetical protein